MIDLQTYRVRIGMFCVRTAGKLKPIRCVAQDSMALGLALILTLLVIGGVERNPGPDFVGEDTPGPSFSGVTLMDVMEAVRITQLQIDHLSSKVHDLTRLISGGLHHANAMPSNSISYVASQPVSSDLLTPTYESASKCTSADSSMNSEARPIPDPTRTALNSSVMLKVQMAPDRKNPEARTTLDSSAALDVQSTPGSSKAPGPGTLSAAPTPAVPAPVPPRCTNSGGWRRVSSHRKRSGSPVPRVGAVLLGCQNVRRIAAAAKDEFCLGGEVVFKSIRGGTVRSALGVLASAVDSCRALSVDLVLHVGGNDLAHRSVDYTVDCIAEVIQAAKQLDKVRAIVVCSVPQDQSSPDNCMSKRRSDLNDEIDRLCDCEGIRFLDLRPRLTECMYGGLDKSRLNLNRTGSRNVWQMLAGEVVGFLD